MVRLTVDGREIVADEGKSLLETCLDNGIFIPNLCFLKEMADPPASCRLCFVEIEGEGKPVAACKTVSREGMVVRTDTEPVRRLQRTALQLLLSVHRLDCCNCPANRKCGLQQIAKFLHVALKQKRLEYVEREVSGGYDHPSFEYDPFKCVLCGRCVFVCQKHHGYSLLTFARRGFDTIISSFGDEDPSDLPCGRCRACVKVCPVGALFLKDSKEPDEAYEAT